MRKIKQILRLFHSGLSRRQIAASLSVSRDTVAQALERATKAEITWPLPDELSEEQLEERLYSAPPRPVSQERPLPDWNHIHRELKRKGVTLQLLWEEYKAEHPDGFKYSWFCDLYRAWFRHVDVVMRQHHKAGEKLFIDYAGHTVPVVDAATGDVHEAQVFVAVLGASNYTFAEATWTQRLPDWIGSHERAFAFFGGVCRILVPDNLKSGVTKCHRYEPDLNPTYADLADHYGVAVIPARRRKPRDKAKAEVGVQIVERWILACLRNRTFFSLAELNHEIAGLLVKLNSRPFKKLPGTRKSMFETVDLPLLRPLPRDRFVYAEWKKARVNIDYHIEVDGHYYSVPYKHARTQLDVRITKTTVEGFLKGQRIASHARSYRKGQHTTVKEHMPKAHREHAEWNPQRIIAWAEKIGPATAELIRLLIDTRTHPEQGYRSALGILRLRKAYGNDRLEAASKRGIAIGARSYKSIASILEKGLDREQLTEESDTEPVVHENIRGAFYYN